MQKFLYRLPHRYILNNVLRKHVPKVFLSDSLCSIHTLLTVTKVFKRIEKRKEFKKNKKQHWEYAQGVLLLLKKGSGLDISGRYARIVGLEQSLLFC